MSFLRPESSVSVAINEWGEEVFAGDAPGPVIHRTPEELGLARVVPHVPPPPRLTIRPDFDERPRRGSMREAGVKRDKSYALGQGSDVRDRRGRVQRQVNTD